MSKLPKIQFGSDLEAPSPTNSKPSVRRKSSTSPLKIQMQTVFALKLEAERRKLISVESQRIIAILDDILQALQIIARIAGVCENFDYFEHLLGSEIASGFLHVCAAMKYPTACEEEFAEHKAAEDEAHFVDSMKDMTSSQKLAIFSAPGMKRIRDVVKTLVRLLRDNRAVLNTICMDAKPSSEILEFLETVEELRKFVFERLQTTEAKEKERLLFLENSPNRERVLKAKIEELEAELCSVKISATQQVNQLKDKIAQLEDDIEKMVTISSEAILQRRMETYQEVEQEEKISKEENAVLETEQVNLQKQYDTMLEKHRLAELNLRKKNFKISIEVENWVIKYDKDMTERLTAYEALSADYSNEKERLRILESEFAPVEAEYMALLAERAAAEEKRLAKIAKEGKFINAAIVIQKYARGWLARKRVKQLKKKKKLN